VKIFRGLFVFFLCLSAVCAPAAAVTTLRPEEQPWRLMERAQIAFDQHDFGASVKFAEEAKRNKAREYAWFVSVLSAEIHSQQIQRTGGKIDAVLRELKDREARNAIEIVSYFTALHDPDYYHDSASELIAYISSMGVFPEAECLIGDVYLLESEIELAKTYYMKAWEQSYALDIPDSKYDILYKLARLAGMAEDDELFEQSLLLVLADDPYYNSTTQFAYLNAVIQAINRGYSADRIFLMYRANTYRSLDAAALLAPFYKRKQDPEKYLQIAILSVLTAFSRMHEILGERDLEYAYTTLDDFFAKAKRYADIQEWITNHMVWECFISFADAAAMQGKQSLAEEIRRIILRHGPNRIVELVRRNQ
jgi:hypothetical protein